MRKLLFIIVLILAFTSGNKIYAQGQGAKVEYVKAFDNINHPEICYWFFSANMFENDRYLKVVDSLAHNSLYTLIFITARNGVDFYDFDKMRPIFNKLVARGHSLGLKIGLQLWDNKKDIAIENTERCITEGEVTLDDFGSVTYIAKAKHIRSMSPLIKSELFKVYAFKKTSDGFYDPQTLKDITPQTTSSSPIKKPLSLR